MNLFNKKEKPESPVTEIDPFDRSMGWDEWTSEKMVQARKEIILEHIREHGERFIDSFEDFLINDRDPWHYGNLSISNFHGRGFSMDSEEDFIEYLKQAEKTAGQGAAKKIKNKVHLGVQREGYPEIFWQTLHDNYDEICEHLSKMWSSSFYVKGWKTPMFKSITEFDDWLEENNHPKKIWQHTSTFAQTKNVNTNGKLSSACLKTL